MKLFYLSLTGLLLAAGHARAQAPTALLQPVQTIGLGEHGTVGGTLRLPNHNLVLLLTDAVSFDVTAQCLAPDGHTLWTTVLTRFQRPNVGYTLDTRQIAIGRAARENKQLRKEMLAAQLYPVNVFTDGNDVVLAERLDEDAVKTQNKTREKADRLKEGQTFVQRLDAQGHLSKHLFEPRPEPESKKTIALTLGRYADATGYVEVVRETNKREETLTFCTLHYDLKTQTVRREPLELPATPEHIGGMNSFRHWYQEWAYLGHRPNQTYFCRRTLVNGPKDKPGTQPIIYQVHLADDLGALAGGFSTTLGLNKGTRPYFSGNMPSPGELNHLPNYYSVMQGKNNYVTYDEWRTSSGGIGSFYLDYLTGDVLIYGEYGEGELPELSGADLLGFFERRFSTDGQVLAQVQGPYSAKMRTDKKKASFKAQYYRQTRFHFDPVSGQSQFSFSPLRVYGNSEDFDLFMDRDLKPLRYDYLPGKDKDERIYTSVTYAQPFHLTTTFDGEDEIRLYEHAGKDDHPVYAALEKQRRTAGADADEFGFYLAPTGPASGLVVEKPLGIGGKLQVFRF